MKNEVIIDTASIKGAKVDIVEMSGSDKNIYFNINGAKCLARVPLEYKFNEKIELKLDINNMFLFDKNTGENLMYKKKVKKGETV